MRKHCIIMVMLLAFLLIVFNTANATTWTRNTTWTNFSNTFGNDDNQASCYWDYQYNALRLVTGDNTDSPDYRTWQWNGTAWVLNSSITGFLDGSYSWVGTGYMYGYLVAINKYGTNGARGNQFNYATGLWVANTSYSMPDSAHNRPIIFQRADRYYGLMGNYYGTVMGFHWSGSAWVYNSTVNSSLIAQGSGNGYHPFVFNVSDRTYMVEFKANTDAYGWDLNSTFGWTLNTSVANGIESTSGAGHDIIGVGGCYDPTSGMTILFVAEHRDGTWKAYTGYGITAPTDTTPPNFNSLANNGSTAKYNQIVQFNVTATDETALSSIIPSTNMSGSWVNGSTYSVSGTSYTFQYNLTNNRTKGIYVCVKFFAKDPSNNWNNSDVSCFTVQNSAPVIVTSNVTSNQYPIYSNSTLLGWCNATDADSDTVSYPYIWYINGTVYQTGSQGNSTYNFTDTPDLYVNDSKWINAQRIVDGNWSSYGYYNDVTYGPGSSYINISYTKPTANSGAIWQIQSPDGLANVTVTSDCFNAFSGTLNFTIESHTAGGDHYTVWYCMNTSTTLKTLYTSTTTGFATGMYAFEEGIYFNVTNPSYTSGILTNVANLTGLNYHNTYILGCNATDGTGSSGYTNSSTITVLNTPPAIVINSPANNDHSNVTLSVSYTYSDAESDPGNCSLYIGGAINATQTSIASGTTNVINGSGMADGSYSWFIHCTDGYNSTNSTARTFVMDTINVIESEVGNPLNDNSTISRYNLTMNITGYDVNLWGYNLTVKYSNGTTLYTNVTTGLTPTTYRLSQLIPLPVTNNYTVIRCWADSHTDLLWAKTATTTKSLPLKQMDYGFNDGHIKITLLSTTSKNTLTDITTQKITDRYTFAFDVSTGIESGVLNTYTFRVDSDLPLYEVKDSKYKAHFVIGNEYWIDFENPGDVRVTEIGKNYFVVQITTKETKLQFNSIGGLNEICYSSTYYFDITPPTFTALTNNGSTAKYGDYLRFNVTAQDGLSLNSILGSYNSSGSWVNLTAASITGTSYPYYVDLQNTRTRGITWCLKFYANDSLNNWNVSDPSCFTVQNTAPILGNPAINNSNPLINETINCNAGAYSDVDSDPEVTANRTWLWYKNGASLAITTQILNITGNAIKGDVLLCQERTYDGYNYSNYANSSSATVENSAPIVTTQNTFNNATSGHSFTVYANVTDPDGASDINLTNISYSTGSCYYLANTTIGNVFGSKWNCSGTALVSTDIIIGFMDQSGVYVSTTQSSNTFSNQNPTISLGNPTDTQNLTSMGVSFNWSASDADADPLTYKLFYSLNSSEPTLQYEGSNAFYIADGLQNGTYKWYVTVSDSYAYVNSSNFTFTIVPPTLNIMARTSDLNNTINIFSVVYTSGIQTLNGSTTTGNLSKSLTYEVWHYAVSSTGYGDITGSISMLGGSQNVTVYMNRPLSLYIQIYYSNNSLANGTDVSLQLISDTYTNSYTTNTGLKYINYIPSNSYELIYSAPGYQQLKYYFTINSSIAANIKLYLLSSSTVPVTITLQDNDGIYATGYDIIAQRYNGADGSYQFYEMARTNNNGEALMFFTLYDNWYKFLVQKSGIVYYISEPRIVDGDFTLIFSHTNISGLPTVQLGNIAASLDYINASGGYFNYIYTDTSGLVSQGCLKVVDYAGIIICSSCANSATATLVCNGNVSNGIRLIGKGSVIYGSTEYTILQKEVDFSTSGYVDMGKSGLFLAILLIIVCVIMFAIHPALAIIGSILALIVSVSLGLVYVSYASVAVMVIVGLIYIIFMRK